VLIPQVDDAQLDGGLVVRGIHANVNPMQVP
jgi:hypothetical protein